MVDVAFVRRGQGRARFGVIACLAWALLAPTAPAAAETLSTTQARGAGAEFVATALPPASIGAICLIDTGVEPTPDTAGVQARISLWDDEIGDTSPTRHGTHVATLIAAPRNGWGMVGIWPAARLISVRANSNGEDRFTVASYFQGLTRCHSLASYYRISVILLALGSEMPLTDEEQAALSDEVASARQHGLSIVAAAGNNGGGKLQTPAQLPGVLSVGGSDGSGARCAISAVGAALQAPGCGLDAIDAAGNPVDGVQGTSEAATVAATALAALRSYRPDLGPDAAQQLLVATATPASGGPLLNVAAAFVAAGLGDVVSGAPLLDPPSTPRPTAPPATIAKELPDLSPPSRKPRLPRPRGTVRRLPHHPRKLVVSVRNRPRLAHVDVQAQRRIRGAESGGRTRLRTVRQRRAVASVVRLSAPARIPLRVAVRYVDPSERRAASKPYVVDLRAMRASRR